MRYLLFCIIQLFIFALYSQIVNIEQNRVGKDTEGFRGNVILNLSYIQNTSEIIQAGLQLQSQYIMKKHSLLFLGSIVYVSVDGNKYLNSGFQHLRYNYLIKNNVLSIEGFAQNQYNEVQKIKNRKLLGGGLRLIMVNRDSLRFYLGTALMYENELTADEELNQLLRASSYLSFHFKLNKNIGINIISYYQPSTKQLSEDYRFTNESKISFKISKYLNYDIKLKFLKDSDPVDGVPENIISFSNGLRFKF